ncbi:MAG TPA: hypothetical protein VG796_03410 [Verrucomicrobiales bacterium]|jgi:hypothetical protein|nr:hypothetical protein [Verrucomicrobiales bacterium]
MSAALAIQNLEREHLGFVMMHFDAEPDGDGICEGDCIFQILPAKAALFESPAAVTLFPYHFRESGEHRVKLSLNGGTRVYEITPISEPPIRIELAAVGEGRLLQSPDFSNPIACVVETAKKA